jgi:hypothetical protein
MRVRVMGDGIYPLVSAIRTTVSYRQHMYYGTI